MLHATNPGVLYRRQGPFLYTVQASCSHTQWWTLVNGVLEKGHKHTISGLRQNGKSHVTDIDIATVLNKWFSDQTNIEVPDGHSVHAAASASPPSSFPHSGDAEDSKAFSHFKIRNGTVKRLLKNLKATKATGSDDIPAILLKECADCLHKPLSRIFRLSLRHGYFPDDWKIANVVALHKKKSKSDPANYRPISLLAIVSKVFETVVASHLKKFIAPRLNPKQFGFRPGHTSLDLLTDLTQRWTDTLEKQGEVRAVALDISKAFDKVWHEGLLYKLSRFGISKSVLSWFTSYLANRTQRVIVGSAKSTFLPVKAGVPQGSVLAPLLFLIFINDLFVNTSNNLTSVSLPTTAHSGQRFRLKSNEPPSRLR